MLTESSQKSVRYLWTISPLLALVIFEVPLFLGLRPDSLWCLPGGILLGAVLLRDLIYGPSQDWLRLLEKRTLTSICALFVLAWLVLIPLKYYALGYSIFDTGLFAQQIHNFFETGHYWNSILHTPALRDHFTPNLLLISPLLFKGSSFTVLHLLKFVAFLSTAYLLVKLSRLILPSNSKFEYAIPALWLVHSFVGRTLDFEFQPSALAPPFVVLAFLLAAQGKRGALLCDLIFLLGFKEHLSLVWICVGIFLLSKDSKDRSAIALIALGALIGPIIYTKIMPLFPSDTLPPFGARFGPLELWPQKISLVGKALLSVGLLPLFAPSSLLWLIPAFGLAFVSRDLQMISFGFHYQDVPLAVLFVAALYGLRNFELGLGAIASRPLLRERAAVLIIGCLIFSNCWFPFRSIRRHLPSERSLALVHSLQDLAKRWPQHCRLWPLNRLGTYFYELPKLDMVFSAEQDFRGDEGAIVLDDYPSAWPLDQSELDRLRSRLKHSSRFKRRGWYPNLEIYATKDCRPN